MKTRDHVKRIICFLMLVIMAAMLLPSAAVRAEEPGKTVRIGWHEAPYFITDQYGRLSGYTYDYQQKLSAYTGWTYEYVKGGWSELMQMLKEGRIDMMGNVSYTQERAKDMLFASLPMGTEVYYLFISPDNTEIRTEDYSTLNGKRVGVAKGSIQCDMFRSWAETHGVSPELIEMTSTEDESLLLLGTELEESVGPLGPHDESFFQHDAVPSLGYDAFTGAASVPRGKPPPRMNFGPPGQS